MNMLPANYFDDSRLKAYLQILKDWKEGTLEDVKQASSTSLIVEVELSKEVDIDKEMSKVVSYECENELVLDFTQVDSEISVNVSSGPKDLIEASTVDRSYRKRDCVRDVPVFVRSKHFSREIRRVSQVCIVFSRITMKVIEIKSIRDVRRFNLDRNERQEKRIVARTKGLLGTTKMFPGTEFAGIKKIDLAKLSNLDYVLAEKLDGMRYIMCVEKGKVYFMDRSSRVYNASYAFDVSENFIVDGEMLDGLFIVFDAIYDSGINVSSCSFPDRVKVIQDIVDRIAQKDILTCQRFYPLTQTSSVYVKALEGLVFIPLDCPYIAGYSDMMFKFKKGYDTLDLKVFKENNRYVCKSVQYLPHGNFQYVFFCVASGVDDKVGMIVEVEYDSGNWRYVRDRLDKRMPNSSRVAEEVKKEVLDPVSIEEVLNAISKRI